MRNQFRSHNKIPMTRPSVAGYSHFFTGDFIKETGTSKDSDFFYAAIQYTF